MQNNDKVQVTGLVSGRVQGVAFRYFVREEAKALNLNGWVRNLSDGRVEFLAEGTRENCEVLLKKVAQGPSVAQVSSLEPKWRPHTGDHHNFQIAPTSKARR
jgi:acylphosphatase